MIPASPCSHASAVTTIKALSYSFPQVSHNAIWKTPYGVWVIVAASVTAERWQVLRDAAAPPLPHSAASACEHPCVGTRHGMHHPWPPPRGGELSTVACPLDQGFMQYSCQKEPGVLLPYGTRNPRCGLELSMDA